MVRLGWAGKFVGFPWVGVGGRGAVGERGDETEGAGVAE